MKSPVSNPFRGPVTALPGAVTALPGIIMFLVCTRQSSLAGRKKGISQCNRETSLSSIGMKLQRSPSFPGDRSRGGRSSTAELLLSPAAESTWADSALAPAARMAWCYRMVSTRFFQLLLKMRKMNSGSAWEGEKEAKGISSGKAHLGGD